MMSNQLLNFSQHVKRSALKFKGVDGEYVSPGMFNIMLPKVGLSIRYLRHMLVHANDVRTPKFLKQPNSLAI